MKKLSTIFGLFLISVLTTFAQETINHHINYVVTPTISNVPIATIETVSNSVVSSSSNFTEWAAGYSNSVGSKITSGDTNNWTQTYLQMLNGEASWWLGYSNSLGILPQSNRLNDVSNRLNDVSNSIPIQISVTATNTTNYIVQLYNMATNFIRFGYIQGDVQDQLNLVSYIDDLLTSGNSPLYFTSDANIENGYSNMTFDVAIGQPEEYFNATATATGATLLASFATTNNDTLLISRGEAALHGHFFDDVGGIASVYYQLYIRHTNNIEEIYGNQSEKSTLLITNASPYTLHTSIFSTNLLSTDKILAKVYYEKYDTSTSTVTFIIKGDTAAALTLPGISIGGAANTNELASLVYVTGQSNNLANMILATSNNLEQSGFSTNKSYTYANGTTQSTDTLDIRTVLNLFSSNRVVGAYRPTLIPSMLGFPLTQNGNFNNFAGTNIDYLAMRNSPNLHAVNIITCGVANVSGGGVSSNETHYAAGFVRTNVTVWSLPLVNIDFANATTNDVIGYIDKFNLHSKNSYSSTNSIIYWGSACSVTNLNQATATFSIPILPYPATALVWSVRHTQGTNATWPVWSQDVITVNGGSAYGTGQESVTVTSAVSSADTDTFVTIPLNGTLQLAPTQIKILWAYGTTGTTITAWHLISPTVRVLR